MSSAKGIIGASHNEGIAVAENTPSGPPPDIAEKLRQLREELAQKAAQQAPKDANTLAWQQSNAFKRIFPRANGGEVHMGHGGTPPSGREMYMPKEPSMLEKTAMYVNDNVAPFVNRGIDAMFPIRQMARTALLSKTQAPLQKMRSENPYAFDYAMDQASNGNMYPLPKQGEMIPVGKASGGQVDMDRMRLELMNKGGSSKHHYPYAEAHEQARLNAIKMLGLHEHNTAQDRAMAMGYDLETYHGTDAPDIESLDPERTKIVKGVFSTTHPRTASRYAEDNKKRAGEKSAPNIIPLLLKSASHKGMSKFDINTINSHRERGDKGAYRPEMQTAITFDPSHMRSRFAAFDPAREHETHLLAANGGHITHAHHLDIEERPL